jgi:4-hydroxybenzoyl-CoA reductase subunit beta
MLRLPKFELRRPRELSEAIALLVEAGPTSVVVAGGTDLVPNMKHELFTPEVVVSLEAVPELRGIRREGDGALSIGAMTSLADVAASELVRAQAPALAQACSLVAGPQLRSMGTLGGNVMLDTRCQWYNQTHFWRQALGFCMKKDGTACHVVEGGKNCVAAASNDSAPALMTLGASLEIEGPTGRRSVAIDDFWSADGIRNKKIGHGEILVRIRVPAPPPGHRGAYGKLRDRGSIDFPLLGVAVRLDVDSAERVEHAEVVVTALAAQPKRISKVLETLRGLPASGEAFARGCEAVAAAARKQCHPLANIPGDHEYRREMVPVYVRRTLRAAAERAGPVHAV